MKMHEKLKAQLNEVKLSRYAATRRSNELNADIQEQLKLDIQKCKYYSLCLDESCNASDIEQLSVFIRMILSDASIKDEFLFLEPLTSTTSEADV